MVDVLMKKLLILMVVLASACTPYKNVTMLSSMSELNYPFEVKKAQLSNDVQIAYVDEGSGDETILFIHGLGSYLPAWKKQIETLKSDYRCVALDLPGYGQSSKGDYSYDMLFFANTVAEFIQKLSLDKVTIVGHSMGGQIAITMGLYHPELMEKLVLVAPAGFETFHEGQKQWFRDIFTAKLVKLTPAAAIQSNLAYNFYNVPEDAEFMITDRLAMRTAEDFDWYCIAIERSVKGMVNQPVFDYLPKLDLPVLVMYGENDNLIPNRYLNPGRTIEIAKSGTERINGAKLRMVPKCGHFAQFDQPDFVNKAIKDFMNN
jgi:pimeloyl-ACP methyl ester carboxylesterase